MKNSIKKDILIGTICVIVSEILFGFAYYVTKLSTDNISPLAILSWRFSVAFISLIILLIAKKIKDENFTFFTTKRIFTNI